MTKDCSPILKNSFFIYKNIRYDVEFYEITDEKIPDILWSQIYAVGNLDNAVPIVKYKESKDNLPGGGVELGESVEETLFREIKEELNMRVVNWKPIGYQKNISEEGNVIYQLRVYAELEKIGEFLEDPGGSVVGYELINICDLNNRIKWGEVGEWLVEKTRAEYGDK